MKLRDYVLIFAVLGITLVISKSYVDQRIDQKQQATHAKLRILLRGLTGVEFEKPETRETSRTRNNTADGGADS